ncbi:MAG: PKD domain-containing protein [bacterium]|nr:PKD domain-containing protein [bacterium]
MSKSLGKAGRFGFCLGLVLVMLLGMAQVASAVVPTADAGGPYTVDECNTVTLDATGSDSDASDTIATYLWDFDLDGFYDDASGTQPAFYANNTYDSGVYTIRLLVTTWNVDSDSDEAQITVTDAGTPTADARGPYSGTECSGTISLDGSGTAGATCDTIDTYSWTFSGAWSDTTVEDPVLSLSNVDSGVYTATLTVTDDDGNTASDTATITITDTGTPIADAGGLYSGTECSGTIPLDGSGTAGATCDTIDTYSWTFSGAWSDTTVEDPVLDLSNVDSGVYTATLTVTDDDGNTASDTATITVTNAGTPTADAGGPYTGTECSDTISLAGSGTAGATCDTINTYRWTFSGGWSDTTVEDPVLDLSNVDSGVYTATLTVTDDDGNTASDTATITVTNVGTPIADAGGPYTGTECSGTISLDGSGTAGAICDTINTYRWTFSGGWSDTTVEDPVLHLSNVDSGVYTATLTVTDDDGNTASDTATITVTNVGTPIADAGGPYTGTECSGTISLDGSGTAGAICDTINTYRWTFSGGWSDTTVEDPVLHLSNVDSGVYTATLTVTDDDGNTASDTATITVTDAGTAIADANGPYGGSVGSPLELDGTGSTATAACDTIETYSWDFTSNGIYDLEGSDSTPTYTYATVGTYIVTLMVTDDDGDTSTDTATVVIWQTPPNVTGRVTFKGHQDSDGDWEIFYVDLVDTTGNIPKQVTDNSYDDIDPCISPDGLKVVYAAKKTNDKFGIYLKNITDGDLTVLCESVEKAAQPSFSTNNDADTWIVFSAIPTSETDWEIYKVKTNGLGMLRLTYDDYNNQAPSHNGTYIVFQSNRGTSNNWEIMRMGMDGNGLTNLTNNDARDMDPAITSTGDTVTFTSDRGSSGDTTDIYVRKSDGSIVQATSHVSTQVSSYFAGDNGIWVVFTSAHETSKGNIYVNYANGTNMAIPASWTTVVNKSGLENMEINSPSWAYVALPDTPTITGVSLQCDTNDFGVKLSWSRGSLNDSEDTFEIQRESTSSAWAFIGSTSETTFLDTTAVNLRGDTVRYRVRGWNIADSSPWAYSNTIFINWTNLWVEVSDSNTVTQGAQVRADIMCDTVYYMDTLHACLTYNTNCFSTPTVRLGDATDTSVHPGTDLMVDIDTGAGTIEFLVNMLDVNSWVTTTSDTSLVEIYLWAIGDSGTCCALDLRRTDCTTLSDSSTMGNTVAQEICVMDVSDTTICISSQPLPTPTLIGDVNCDGKVRGMDITKLERCLLGLDSDCYCNWANADANQDGRISSADITAIERIILGLDPAPAPSKITTSEAIAKLKMRGVATRELTLFVGEVKGFDTLQCDLNYDPARVRIEKVEAGSIIEGACIRSNIQNGQGRIRILLNMPGITGINGSGDLLKITLAEAASAGDISINRIVLGSNQAIELPFELLNPEAIPSQSFLSQSYPNPLNPEAWIPFGLSQPAKVVINIYSVSGQLIRTLDLGKKPVGIYEDKEKAAYWDGKDNQGHKVASGVYLYQLKAGDFISTRKMIVVK